ncbi:MAG: hypothetical protein GY795_20165 [Desulfobacterales bacterium]|nr:hypothetical protein [Desulfobacterales bacterium]
MKIKLTPLEETVAVKEVIQIEIEKREKEEGKKKAKEEIAVNLIKLGIDVKIISQATGLSQKKIKQLALKNEILMLLEKLKGESDMEDMDLELTREELAEMVQFMMTVLTVEEIMEGIPLEKRLEGVPPKQIKAYLEKIGENLS